MREVALPPANSWSMVSTRLLTHNVKLRKSAENIKFWLNCSSHCPKLKLREVPTQDINFSCCQDRSQSLSYFAPHSQAGSTNFRINKFLGSLTDKNSQVELLCQPCLSTNIGACICLWLLGKNLPLDLLGLYFFLEAEY